MLEIIVVILILLWILGLAVNVGGAFIHGLLVLALIVFIYRLVTGHKA